MRNSKGLDLAIDSPHLHVGEREEHGAKYEGCAASLHWHR